jgi:hypothetical protein
MATLTPTATTVKQSTFQQSQWRLITFTLATDTYATGGFVVDHADVEHIDTMQIVGGMGGYGPLCQWDEANQKLIVYIGDYNNGTDGPLVELANSSSDLQSFTTVRAIITGE